MKYEKLEEWMIGKKFYNVYEPEDRGVIVAETNSEGVVDVVYENDGPSLARICNIIFVDSAEEKPSEKIGAQENSQINWEGRQIDWQVGQEVFCLLRGRGFVERVGDEDEGTPYTVGVDFGYTFDNYTIDGKIFDDHKGRVLFFSEPIVTAELFPPKKPSTPTLKEGECVLLWLSKECAPVFVTIIEEKEDKLFYMHTNGQKDYTSKDGIKIGRLGEEIKFS